MQVRIKPEVRAKVSDIADLLGVPASEYVEALLEREELDETGRPLWWPHPVPKDQEELPLRTA